MSGPLARSRRLSVRLPPCPSVSPLAPLVVRSVALSPVLGESGSLPQGPERNLQGARLVGPGACCLAEPSHVRHFVRQSARHYGSIIWESRGARITADRIEQRSTIDPP